MKDTINFEKILIVAKNEKEKQEISNSKIKEHLGKKDITLIELKEVEKELIDNFDLIITFGGDGTFVRTSNLVNNAFILGINSNPDKSEGALTTISINELDKLEKLIEDDFEILTRHRIKVKLNGKELKEHSLNEVYVGAESQFHTSRYKINFQDKEEEHRSSGIIISTGTGSPAWFYSAGGKIFDSDEKKLGFIVREPYFGKRVYSPTILQGDIKEGEKLIIKSEKDFGGIIAINESIYEFNKGGIVEIELSDKPIRTIKLK